jgi:arginase
MNKTKKARKTSISLFGINDCHKPKNNTKKGYEYRIRKIYKRPKTLKNYSKKVFRNIILFPHDLGQTKHGVEKAPKFLKKYINKKHHRIYNVEDKNDFFTNIHNLYDMNKKIGGPKVNIGGDHSMSIATIADTMNRYPNAKVIYFDAHADINTYASSNSKHYHGMPLSFVTGIDHDDKFTFIKNKLKLENLLYIGGRCWDTFERDLIYKHNIKHIDPHELNTDFENATNKILTFAGNSPIHVSFDVDSMDKSVVPSTGTAVKGGIKMNIGKDILQQIKNHTNVVNVDITELNMDLGTQKETQRSLKNTDELFKSFLT